MENGYGLPNPQPEIAERYARPIVARKFDDHKVLQVSALWESLFADRRRTPQVHAAAV